VKKRRLRETKSARGVLGAICLCSLKAQEVVMASSMLSSAAVVTSPAQATMVAPFTGLKSSEKTSHCKVPTNNKSSPSSSSSSSKSLVRK
jgi:hypothetical protein